MLIRPVLSCPRVFSWGPPRVIIIPWIPIPNPFIHQFIPASHRITFPGIILIPSECSTSTYYIHDHVLLRTFSAADIHSNLVLTSIKHAHCRELLFCRAINDTSQDSQDSEVAIFFCLWFRADSTLLLINSIARHICHLLTDWTYFSRNLPPPPPSTSSAATHLEIN